VDFRNNADERRMVEKFKLMKMIVASAVIAAPLVLGDNILARLSFGFPPISGALLSLLPLSIIFGVSNMRKVAFLLPLVGGLSYSIDESIGPPSAFKLAFYGGFFVCSLLIEKMRGDNGNFK